MTALTFREFFCDSADYPASVRLRDQVLRLPLGLTLTAADTDNDPQEWHFGAFDGTQLIASVTLRHLGGPEAKLRQMAVHPDYHRRGIGRELVRLAEKTAQHRGVIQVTLHARDTAVVFYQSLGYCCHGEYFEEQTIPHIEMTRNL